MTTYSYDFVWFSGASTDFTVAAGSSMLLDVCEDPNNPDQVLFTVRNTLDNEYDSSGIVNIAFDIGAEGMYGSPLFTNMYISGRSGYAPLEMPGDYATSLLYSPAADYGIGLPPNSQDAAYGINLGESLTVTATLGAGYGFADVISALEFGMADSYTNSSNLREITAPEKLDYNAFATEGLRISILVWSVVPNEVNPDGHGLFVTDGIVNIEGTALASRVLDGTQAPDRLVGASGAVQMSGFSGNDTYVVDDWGDTVIEEAGQGIDTVETTVSFRLPANVENLVLLGSNAIKAGGNELDNLFLASDGDNYIDGKTRLDGQPDQDALSYSNSSSVVTVSLGTTAPQMTGGSGMDTILNIENLTGSAFDDRLTGSRSANVIDGGAGADTMSGGSGNDTYVVDNAGDAVTDSSGTDTVRSYISYTLGSYLENLVLLGTAADGTGNTLNNMLTGNDASNVLTGLAGNDTLDGGGGIDTLKGGAGNDVYIVDTDTDYITELAGEGTDTVISSVNYGLGSNIEKLTLTGLAAVATGNALANTITGNTGDNTLYGLDGNDTLDGGGGTDTLIGGKGNDTFVVDGIDDTIVEVAGEGTDTVKIGLTYILGATLENLTLTGGASIDGTGNASNNVLTGNSGSNTLIGLADNDALDGGAGSDVMIGGTGNDTYVVDSASDVVTELAGQGTDTVNSSITYTLTDTLETLRLTGSSAIDGTGNAAANTLTGNTGSNTLMGLGGNDTLDGGRGNDILIGGIGNDSYVVDSLGDVITEFAEGGTDTINSSVSYTLSDTLENLTLTGSLAINGTGNGGSNTLTGNSYGNRLDGGAGNDVLVGGKGGDVLIGGTGADRFDFNYLTDSPVGAGRDAIDDFSSAEADKIDLSTLDANTLSSGNQAFTFIGDAAFYMAGQLRYAEGMVAGGFVVQGDVNGDGVADFEIAVIGVSYLVASDFIA